MSKEDDKKKDKLARLKETVEKHFGKGSILLLGDTDPPPSDVLPTSIYSLDRALGIGGLPMGRIIEIFGPESGGKTTVALYAVAAAQRRGNAVAFVDAEHALDLTLARRLGVNTEELLISQPDNGEQALEIVEHLARTGEVGVIVVDSVTALTPKAELAGNMGDSHMGVQARLMSQACRKLVAAVAKTNTMLIFINQLRMKIGVMFGNPETTTGGNALKFYSSIRLEVRPAGKLKEGEEVIGHTMKITVAKNKMAPPFKKVLVPLLYGKGVDKVGDIFDMAVKLNIVKKSGSWYSFNEERLAQGRDNSVNAIADNQELLDSIVEKLDATAEADEELS